MPGNIRVSVGRACAADRATRTATTGMVQRLGRHPAKNDFELADISWAVSECEFSEWMHGAAHALGLRAYMHDFGISLLLVIESDSTSAKPFARRRALAKQRHTCRRATRGSMTWLQQTTS